jgi:hypothetical protein
LPKSIIDIEVNDERFKQFLVLFEDYRAQLDKMKGFWTDATKEAEKTGSSTEDIKDNLDGAAEVAQELAEAIGEANDAATQASGSAVDIKTQLAIAAAQAEIMMGAFSGIEGALLSAAGSIEKLQGGTEKSASAAKDAGDHFGTVADRAASIAGSIGSATLDLAKWATFTLGAGLVGMGAGIFGLDRIAGSASDLRFSSQGLGISSAEMQAFNLNFGSRLVGDDFLNTVQGVKADITRRWQFQQLGISSDEVQNDDPARLGVDVIKRAKALWDQAGPAGRNDAWMQAHGIGGFMDFSTWQRIGASSPGDLAAMEGQYSSDVTSFGMSPAVLKDWQDLDVQLKRSNTQIEDTLITGLHPLARPLADLSKAVSDVLAAFLSNPHMHEWIEDAATALESFAKYLGTPQFAADMKTLADGISIAAGDIVDALKWLGLIPKSATPGGRPAATSAANPASAWVLPDGLPQLGNVLGPGLPSVGLAPMFPGHPGLSFIGRAGTYDFTKVANFYHLPPELFSADAQLESGTNPHPKDSVVKGRHYQGMFQMGPVMQEQFGVTNPYDPDQEANAFGMAMLLYQKAYGGDLKKSLAAYNWGPGHLADDIKAHGDNWLEYAPTETQKYVANIMAKIPSQSMPDPVNGTAPSSAPAGSTAALSSGPHAITTHVKVKVMNQTGAQVAVLANASRQ